MVSTERFEVQGAGEIHVGTNANAWCGTAAGFLLRVSWGKHGLAGGVLDRDEAKRLADMIYAALETAEPRDEVCRVRA